MKLTKSQEQLKKVAKAAEENYGWREKWEQVRQDFESAATPTAVLEMLALIEDIPDEAMFSK